MQLHGVLLRTPLSFHSNTVPSYIYNFALSGVSKRVQEFLDQAIDC
jgi:hypothetical protein